MGLNEAPEKATDLMAANLSADNQKFRDMRQKVMAIQKEMYDLVCATIQGILDGKYSRADEVDCAILCGDIQDFAEEIRKDAAARTRVLGRRLAIAWATKALQDPTGTENKWEGVLGTGYSESKQAGLPPKRGTPEFQVLTLWMGFPESMTGPDSPVKLGFKELSSFLTNRVREGKPLPPGIKLLEPEFTTIFRRHKTYQQELSPGSENSIPVESNGQKDSKHAEEDEI